MHGERSDSLGCVYLYRNDEKALFYGVLVSIDNACGSRHNILMSMTASEMAIKRHAMRTPEQRTAQARKAAMAMWEKRRKLSPPAKTE
jgi:hypothetical protein